MAGVLVAGGPEPGCSPAEGGRAADIGLSTVVPLVDDVRVLLPDAVVAGAGFGGACLPGVL